jgi:hypothetical protein
MCCAARFDWLEGRDELDQPPPSLSMQHDPDGAARYARRIRRTKIRARIPWFRRRAASALVYAIHGREVELGWRSGRLTQWTLR